MYEYDFIRTKKEKERCYINVSSLFKQTYISLIYRRWGSNPHVLNGHWILSPARLPVPPLRQKITNDWIHPVKGGNRIRTDDKGFADLCLTTWLYHHNRLSNLIGPAKQNKMPNLGRYVGIEPTRAGTTIRCVNPFTNTAITLQQG